MKKIDEKRVAEQWGTVMREQPEVARIVIVQQAILLHASRNGYRPVDVDICEYLRGGGTILFDEYWRQRCNDISRDRWVSDTIGCLASGGDPGDCLNVSPSDWFNDPFAGGRVFPDRPGIPPE